MAQDPLYERAGLNHTSRESLDQFLGRAIEPKGELLPVEPKAEMQITIPRPLGARVLVEELVTSLSARERFKRAGLILITNQDDNPENYITLGRIIALGPDPFLQENGLAVGKVVYFNRHSGTNTYHEGVRYRTLELQELTNVVDALPSDARPLSLAKSQDIKAELEFEEQVAEAQEQRRKQLEAKGLAAQLPAPCDDI